MTFFEWIRGCLCLDAKLHPIPRSCKRELKKLLQSRPRGDPGPDRAPLPQK